MCSDRGLCAKDAAALLSSPREDFSAVPIGHAYPKSHFVFSLAIMRLKCTFHEGLLSKNVPAKSQRMIVYSRRVCQVFYQQPLYKPTGRREFRFPIFQQLAIVAIRRSLLQCPPSVDLSTCESAQFTEAATESTLH